MNCENEINNKKCDFQFTAEHIRENTSIGIGERTIPLVINNCPTCEGYTYVRAWITDIEITKASIVSEGGFTRTYITLTADLQGLV